MPALATRFTGGTAESRGTGPRDARPPTTELRKLLSTRLSGEFLALPAETVDRCVEDVWACAAHLGVDVTTAVVERIAREHLLALANSAPLVYPAG